jgi:hypothetical protein
MENLI